MFLQEVGFANAILAEIPTGLLGVNSCSEEGHGARGDSRKHRFRLSQPPPRMSDDSEPHSCLVARSLIRANCSHTIVINLTLGIVTAIDADSERVLDVVSLHDGHRHFRQRERTERRADNAIVGDPRLGEVRDDPLLPADDGASLDEARVQVERERDVDPLGVRARR